MIERQAPAHRRQYLDWLRGIGVLIMIEGHALDSWTRLEDRTRDGYERAILIAGFTESVILGFLGFLIMVGSAFLFYLNAAKMGKAGLQSVSQRTGNITEIMGRRSQKLKDRFRREGEE